MTVLQPLAQSSGNQNHIQALTAKRKKPSDLLDFKVQLALVRSRFQNVAQMDAPSMFFFYLWKKNGQKRYIYNLCSETGAILSEPAKIRQRAVSFYEKLYTCKYRED